MPVLRCEWECSKWVLLGPRAAQVSSSEVGSIRFYPQAEWVFRMLIGIFNVSKFGPAKVEATRELVRTAPQL